MIPEHVSFPLSEVWDFLEQRETEGGREREREREGERERGENKTIKKIDR